MTREVVRDISKRPLDISQLSVHVTRGVVHLGGRIERLRGYDQNIDLNEEVHIMIRLLKQKPGIRDVCCEVDIAGDSLTKRTMPGRKRSHY